MIRQCRCARYGMSTNLCKLPPVQVVAGIIFEDENVIDLVLVPDPTRHAEQEKKKVDQEVSSVDLQ